MKGYRVVTEKKVWRRFDIEAESAEQARDLVGDFVDEASAEPPTLEYIDTTEDEEEYVIEVYRKISEDVGELEYSMANKRRLTRQKEKISKKAAKRKK